MKQLLYSLSLLLSVLTVQAQPPAVTMTTTTAVGRTFSFDIAATAENTHIQVDWGDGVLTDYAVGTSNMSVTGTLTGNTIKVYAAGITHLNLTSKSLTALDLSGAIVLKGLLCDINQLTNLDVSKNTALTKLICYLNQLTNLDISKNTALTTLNCYSNQLTDLDVSKNIALNNFDCGSNKLTVLDVSKNTALTFLDCSSNQLTNLDVSTNTALTKLYCNSNKLTVLDVSTNTGLTTLTCYSNQLTNLDISKNTTLTILNCGSNQLTNLDVSKNTALTSLDCSSNQLTFTTLPIKQITWWYDYSPQSALKLPKADYVVSEVIDLSSQLTAKGNTTNYEWKTEGGRVLASGVDYSANNGVFTFIKAQPSYVYCEMNNGSFLDLMLRTTNVKITQFPTSVEEMEVKVTVFPNPVRDNLCIESAESIVRVEVFTVTGLKVYAIDGNNTNTMTLLVANWPKGLWKRWGNGKKGDKGLNLNISIIS